MKTQKRMFIGIILIAALIAGCSAQSATAPAETTIDHTQDKEVLASESSTPETTEGVSAPLKQFSVKAFRFGFEPSTLTVKQGDTVFLQASTIDVKHGLAIPEYGVDLILEPGQEKTAVFVADKKGAFRMFCSVPCGAGHTSMTGQLIVE